MIADLGGHLRRNAPERARVIDCKGHVLCPGLIDMQVFTGEPGQEHRETLKTASHAAAAGGVTTIVVMPDTEPVIDQVALVDFIQRRARDNAVVNVHVMAAMTRGLKGQEMTEIGLLQRAGAVAFTNGKSSVANARVMRNVLLYAKDFGALIVHHTEDPHLTEGSGDELGRGGDAARPAGRATRRPRPSCWSATCASSRSPAGATTPPQLTCAESLAVMRAAKARKLPVTCGVSINHLTLNENDIGPYRTFFRLKPPLRSEDDRAAMVRGLAAGDIDVIVSSHDPQDADTKRHPFAEAADGAIGLETLLAAALRLYHNGEIGLLPLLRAMTINPAKLLGLPVGPPREGRAGRPDPGRPRPALGGGQGARLRARSKNSPFDESKMQGRVLLTMVAGNPCTNTLAPSAADAARSAEALVMGHLFSVYGLLALLAGYLLGSIPFGLLLTKAAGLGDVRNIGSGNIGATNVLRTGHKGLAAATLLLDALKGTVAVLLVYDIARAAGSAPVDAITYCHIAGLGAFLGHIYPVWLRLSGRQGRRHLHRRADRHALGRPRSCSASSGSAWRSARAIPRWRRSAATVAVVLYYLVTGWAGLPFIVIMSALSSSSTTPTSAACSTAEESKIGAES